MKPFVFGSFNLTRRCNLKCGYCGIYNNEVKELELQEVKNIIVWMGGICENVSIVGGEPLMYSSVSALVEWLNLEGIKYSMSTNGILVKKSWEEGIRPELYCLSIDNFEGGSFVDKYSKIKSLTNWNNLSYLSLYGMKGIVSTTVGKRNIRDLSRIISVVDSYGWKCCINIMQKPKELVAAGCDCLEEGDILDIKEAVDSILYSGRDIATARESLVLWDSRAVRQDWKCSVRDTLLVDSDGTLGSCTIYKGRNLEKLKWGCSISEIAKCKEQDIMLCSGCYLDTAVTSWFIRRGFGKVI